MEVKISGRTGAATTFLGAGFSSSEESESESEETAFFTGFLSFDFLSALTTFSAFFLTSFTGAATALATLATLASWKDGKHSDKIADHIYNTFPAFLSVLTFLSAPIVDFLRGKEGGGGGGRETKVYWQDGKILIE